MSDTATVEVERQAEEEMEKIVSITKRGFDLKARLENRGLRKATITLYLDEELGPELGWAHNVQNQIGQVIARERVGVIGELDEVQAARDAAVSAFEGNADKMTPVDKAKAKKSLDAMVEKFDERITELTAKRDELIAKLTETGITIQLRAVPPVIEKDTRRKAKATLGITTKTVPEDKKEEFVIAQQAHLMTMVFQSVRDNATGIVNTETTYEDAIALMDFLPPGQWQRLDAKIGEVQFTDAISLQIESQEDFS